MAELEQLDVNGTDYIDAMSDMTHRMAQAMVDTKDLFYDLQVTDDETRTLVATSALAQSLHFLARNSSLKVTDLKELFAQTVEFLEAKDKDKQNPKMLELLGLSTAEEELKDMGFEPVYMGPRGDEWPEEVDNHLMSSATELQRASTVLAQSDPSHKALSDALLQLSDVLAEMGL